MWNSCRSVGMGQQGNVARHLEQFTVSRGTWNSYTLDSPIDAGYLTIKYHDHWAGCQLVSISKAPKTGFLQINITNVWQRIAAKGLLAKCVPWLPKLAKYFQTNTNGVFNLQQLCQMDPLTYFIFFMAFSAIWCSTKTFCHLNLTNKILPSLFLLTCTTPDNMLQYFVSTVQ